MPPVAIAVAAAAAAYGASAAAVAAGLVVAGSIGATAIGVAASLAVSFAGSAILGATADSASSVIAQNTGLDQMVRSTVAARTVVYGRAKLSGPMLFAASSSSDGGAVQDNFFLHLVVGLTHGEIDGVERLFLNDEEVPFAPGGLGYVATSGRYASDDFNRFLVADFALGTADQSPFPVLRTYLPDLWTPAHRLRGLSALYLRLGWDADVYANGLPNPSVVLRGRKLFDPRTGLATFNDNAALAIRDYLTADFGLRCTAEEIDDASFIAAANICAEVVTKADGTQERRYTCNGVIQLDAAPQDILQQLLTSCGGRLVYASGKWSLYAAAYRTPTVTLDEGDLRGPIKVTARIATRDGFNTARGTFIDPGSFYQQTDLPPVTNAAYVAEDGGEEAVKEFAFPFTQSAATGQRLLKVELERVRRQIAVSYPAKLTAYRVKVGDVVMIDNARFGWAAKTFEVTGWVFSIGTDEQGAPVPGIDLSLRETDANVFAWSADEETPLPAAPTTNLPDPFTIAPPGVPTITESLYQTRDGGGVKAKATVSWAASPIAFAETYQLEHKLAAAAAYTVLAPTRDLSVELLDMAPGVHDFRVKALSILGVSSAYVTTRKEIVGLSAAPADVTGLSVSIISSLALLQFDRHPDLDVRAGGYLRFRHSTDTVAPSWESATDIGPAVDGNATQAILPAVAGAYLVKAIDSSGIPSATAAFVVTNAASLFTFSNLETVTESPTFAGTTTSCAVSSGKLSLTGNSLFDDIADLDAVASLDTEGGIAASGTYEFASGTDLGAVATVRVTATLTGAVVNTLDQIDSRGATVDDWEDFDGAVSAAAGAYVEIRQTDDDPAGTPAWSAWQRLRIGDYRARAFEYRAHLFTDDPAFNFEVSALSRTIDQVA